MEGALDFARLIGPMENDYVKQWRAGGGRVMGFFCAHAPEELLWAAGILPLRMRGTGSQETSHADDVHLARARSEYAILLVETDPQQAPPGCEVIKILPHIHAGSQARHQFGMRATKIQFHERNAGIFHLFSQFNPTRNFGRSDTSDNDRIVRRRIFEGLFNLGYELLRWLNRKTTASIETERARDFAPANLMTLI